MENMPASSEANQQTPTNPADISDLIKVDSKGKGHISGSITGPDDLDGRSRNGQFLSQYEIDQIAANADLIRNNLPTTEPTTAQASEPLPEPPSVTVQIPVPEPTPPEEPAIDPSDPMHPGYSGLASASPAVEPTPEPTPPEEPLPTLSSINVGRVKGGLQSVAETTTHMVEEEKVENSRLGIFRRFAKNMKFMTLFKDETVRRRGAKLLEGIRKEPPPLTTEEINAAIKGASGVDSDADDQLILEMMSNPALRRASGDKVIEGSGEEDEHPAVAKFRQGISDALIPYLQETRDPNLSPEELQERTQAYQDQLRTLAAAVMEENPDFNHEALSIMADSFLELANEARVFIGHENGLNSLKEQLRTVKISLGEMQISPNAEYNTEYLERTLDRMKDRRVDSMFARASFSVGTFVLSGAMAHGLSEFTKQTATRSGAKYGGAVVGGLLLGPVGVGVGLAASSLASAMFARKLAIDQGRKTIAHIGVEQGDSAATAKTELVSRLGVSTLNYSDIDRVYSEHTIEQEQPDGTTIRVLKPDLSTEEALSVIQLIGDARVRLASEESSTPKLNLLSSQTPASYLTERISALKSLDSLTSMLDGKVFEVPTGRLDEAGQPITKSVDTDKLLVAAAATASTEINSEIEKVQRMQEQYLKTEGRKAAILGGAFSALGGVSAFGLTELMSHGVAPSVVEGLGLKSGNGEATQRVAEASANRAREALSSNSGNVTAHFNSINGSKVEVLQGGKTVSVETPTGRHMEIPLNSSGEVSTKDLLELKRHGVNLQQATTRVLETKPVSVDTAFDKLGGKPMEVSTWLGNNTIGSDGTELGTHLGLGGQGQIIIEQNPGTAFEGTQRFDLSQMASEGKLNAYLINNGKTVAVPMQLAANGNMYAAIPADSPLRSMFAQQSNGWWAYQGSEWHIGIATADPNKFDSVSTLIGPGVTGTVTEQVPVSTTSLNFDFVNTAPAGDRETEYILGGFAPTPDGGLLYEDKKDNGNGELNPPASPVASSPSDTGAAPSSGENTAEVSEGGAEGNQAGQQASTTPVAQADDNDQSNISSNDEQFLDNLADSSVPILDEELESMPGSGEQQASQEVAPEENVSIYGSGGLLDQWAKAKNDKDDAAAATAERKIREIMVKNKFTENHINEALKRMRPYMEQRRIALRREARV